MILEQKTDTILILICTKNRVMMRNIVFLFLNEENNIPELVRRTVQVMNSLKDVEYEMIFVNDDSKDESFNSLTEFQKNYPNLNN